MKKILFKISSSIAILIAIVMLGLCFWGFSQLIEINKSSIEVSLEEVYSPINTSLSTSDNPNYHTQIIDILQEHQLDTSNSGIIEGWISKYPDEIKKNFLSSFSNLLDEKEKLSKKRPNENINTPEIINSFNAQFEKKFNSSRNNIYNEYEQIAYTGAIALLIMISLLMFIATMAIPILVQIEKNTSIKPSS